MTEADFSDQMGSGLTFATRSVGAFPASLAISVSHAASLVCNDAMTPAETVMALHEAMELRDDSAFGHIAEDFIQHAAGPQGRAGFRQTLATLEHDLDRPTATIHRLVAQDDLVVVQLTMHGRHVASTMPLLAGLPPTGSAIAWDFIHVWRVADGLIVEHWACRDDVGLLGQVGGWPQSR